MKDADKHIDWKKALAKGCFLLSIVYCLSSVTACQSQHDKTPVLGDLDSSAIAIDTNMQKGFESSYEFHKTLLVNDKLVYDVIGYGGPASHGEFAILRRGADNKSDTVAKGKREGIIANAFVADLNGNAKEEVYITTQSVSAAKYGNIIGYEIDAKAKTRIEISYDGFTIDGYVGQDSFYLLNKEIVRSFPLFDTAGLNPENDHMQSFYALKNYHLINDPKKTQITWETIDTDKTKP